MIVKIQISQNDGGESVLIYNRERSLSWQYSSESVLPKMKGRPKAYFHAAIVGDELEIGEEAPWQGW